MKCSTNKKKKKYINWSAVEKREMKQTEILTVNLLLILKIFKNIIIFFVHKKLNYDTI